MQPGPAAQIGAGRRAVQQPKVTLLLCTQTDIPTSPPHFFYVLEGEMEMDIEGEPSRTVKTGELFIVPKGVVHRPRAKTEVKVLLIEPKGEPNSGDSDHEPAPKPRI
ncbi:cupin domain-containing protein [Rhizobium ruizarguesonis]|uniref:cupin domain-containing protein n=1 Tax=Rhizobium ruizarguesonis TaxID=2081791 RepID=UPI001FEE3E10|nr:cupin domain-containing protein [Rhizobium ruizarguesonis]